MSGHPVVGTGAESFWHRRTNTYPGCTCPPWRYSPAHPKPTNPECPTHGDTADTAIQVSGPTPK